jgi:hypothetical protein
MEPEGSLPYSQVPATHPYPEPTPSSPHDLHQHGVFRICCMVGIGTRRLVHLWFGPHGVCGCGVDDMGYVLYGVCMLISMLRVWTDYLRL